MREKQVSVLFFTNTSKEAERLRNVIHTLAVYLYGDIIWSSQGKPVSFSSCTKTTEKDRFIVYFRNQKIRDEVLSHLWSVQNMNVEFR